MTTAMIRPALTTPAEPTAWSIGAPRLLAGLDHGLHRLDRRAHYAIHGPQPAVDLPRLLGMLDGVALVNTAYWVSPILAVPEGSVRFFALTAFTTSKGVSPRETSFAGSFLRPASAV